MQSIKNYLEAELSEAIHNSCSDRFIFSFEHRTPRLSMLNLETQKMKKITIVPEETSN